MADKKHLKFSEQVKRFLDLKKQVLANISRGIDRQETCAILAPELYDLSEKLSVRINSLFHVILEESGHGDKFGSWGLFMEDVLGFLDHGALKSEILCIEFTAVNGSNKKKAPIDLDFISEVFAYVPFAWMDLTVIGQRRVVRRYIDRNIRMGLERGETPAKSDKMDFLFRARASRKTTK